MTFCPDCQTEIDGDFIAHRENEHPPELKVLTVDGIASETRFGTDPPEED